jgi:hypothetical protein
MAIGYGNVDSNGNGNGDGDGDGNGDCNVNVHGNGDNDKGRVASSCAGSVQHCDRGNTLPPPPWTQRKVHSPALHHGGDTAKSVCSLSRGGGFLTAHHGLFFVYFLQLLFSLLINPLFAPCIIKALKNPVGPLTLYLLHSSKNPISLLTIYPGFYCMFCQGKPGQGLKWL